MKTQIFKDYEEFRNKEDESVNGVSADFAEKRPGYEEQNSSNTGCWECWNCTGCWDCDGCTDCRYCRYCTGCADCVDYEDLISKKW